MYPPFEDSILLTYNYLFLIVSSLIIPDYRICHIVRARVESYTYHHQEQSDKKEENEKNPVIPVLKRGYYKYSVDYQGGEEQERLSIP